MSLAAGTYTIRSALPNGLYVGRNPATNDQTILAQPQGGQPNTWEIEDAGDGKYSLKTDGHPTGVVGSGVSTILEGPGDKWDLEPVPQQGVDQFVIRTNDRTLGWVLPENDAFTPVAVGPIFSTKTFPPQYGATERWIIEKSLQDLD